MSIAEAFAREATYIRSVGRTLYRMRHVKPESTTTIADLVEGFARDRPDNLAILYQDETLTYRELDARANRYANWARSQGVGRGDVVALLMENRPDYIAAWLGIVKLGAIAALLNTNLRGSALVHSLTVAGARHLILGAELASAYAEARPALEAPPVAWIDGGTDPGGEDLEAALGQAATDLDPAVRAGLTCKEIAFYIFTSGTTGLPKAANISHMRMLFMMYGFAGALNATERDRMYNVLPLYHTAGGICALGPALTTGGSLVIRNKFSTHEFWDDCRRYRPTFFQYIGELCRYLLNAPPAPHEADHCLRVITGNGLRPEIWPAFQKRFAIPKIIEFYGATEGNVSMLNYDGTVGAVGRIPSYMRSIMQTRLVRFDVERETPVRGEDGFCIECTDGEAGEAIGKIVDEPGRNFEGYTKKEDTRKKILNDVFQKGDSLVPYRRSSAPRRAWLFLLCRPDRRHLPMEGRKRLDQRSRRSVERDRWHQGGQCLWRLRSRDGRPCRHGRAGHRSGVRCDRTGRKTGRQSGQLCPADISAAAPRNGNHWNLQIAQGRARQGRVRSGYGRRSTLCLRCANRPLCAAGCIPL